MNNFIIIIGVLLIAIGTLLTYYGTDRKNRETNKQLTQSMNAKNTQIDELVEGKNVLIAQNKTLSGQIEKYQQNLQAKDEKIKELEKFAKKELYKPLSPDLEATVISNLKPLGQQQIKEVLVDVLDGDNNCKRIRENLVSLLNRSAINAKHGSTGFTFNKSAVKPGMKMNKNTSQIAKLLADALQPYLRVQFIGKIDDSLDDGVIHINLRGTPLFHEDGAIEFQ